MRGIKKNRLAGQKKRVGRSRKEKKKCSIHDPFRRNDRVGEKDNQHALLCWHKVRTHREREKKEKKDKRRRSRCRKGEKGRGFKGFLLAEARKKKRSPPPPQTKKLNLTR